MWSVNFLNSTFFGWCCGSNSGPWFMLGKCSINLATSPVPLNFKICLLEDFGIFERWSEHQKLGICVREDGLLWINVEPNHQEHCYVLGDTSSRRIPGLSGSDLGNPAETGWRRGMGFLCHKILAIVCYYKSLSIFLWMEGVHRWNLATWLHSNKWLQERSTLEDLASFWVHPFVMHMLCPLLSHCCFFHSIEA